MSRQAAARVRALLRNAYPDADIRAVRVFGGLRIEVGGGFSALIGSERSKVLEQIAAQRGGQHRD